MKRLRQHLLELYGKGRFGEIRRHHDYMRHKTGSAYHATTAARADAVVDDASRERRAALRGRARTERDAQSPERRKK